MATSVGGDEGVSSTCFQLNGSNDGEEEEEEEEEREGVLLYYKYVDVMRVVKGGQSALRDFLTRNCTQLGLVGRVRCAEDGLNATLGGKLSRLKQHARDIGSLEGFQGIDFKLQASPGSLNDMVELESGFNGLSVQLTKEVVTMGPRAVGVKHEDCATHLAPAEFHQMLNRAADQAEQNGTQHQTTSEAGEGEDKGDKGDKEDVILIDVRNVYESRIGRFVSDSVKTLIPETRTFSQFPKWVDTVENDLRHKQILMYCTGGVRCERASSYLRSKGPAFHNCFQLEGGIQRYLEAFPDGGYFKGKNFVFDSRSSVPPAEHQSDAAGEAGGLSNVVGQCMNCKCPYDDYGSRARCSYCRLLILLCPSCIDTVASTETQKFCEICNSKGASSSSSSSSSEGKKKEGMSGNVSKGKSQGNGKGESRGKVKVKAGERATNEKGKLKILCLHGFRQTAKSFRGRTAAVRKRMKKVAEFVYIDAPFEVRDFNEFQPAENADSSFKRSWLLAQENAGNFEASLDKLLVSNQSEAGGSASDDSTGWDVTFQYLKHKLEELGPFDGILGFSQGAAILGLLCSALGEEELNSQIKFVVLASGFKSKSHPAVFDLSKPFVNIPSLHIIGGSDKQVAVESSEELADVFDPGTRSVLRHDQGHIIPCSKSYAEDYIRFLEQFN